ncbi:MAG: PAS domain S-box protein, partial [Candidatus Electryonea clarkiae]|nr:PAS domain S-box protein [Candidatus Electryonea clarkiae]
MPEDTERARKDISRIMKGENIRENEYSIMRKDGSIFSATVHSAPIIQNNKPVGMRGIIVDITERKQAEEKLREERSKAQSYLDIALVIFMALDHKGEVTMINRRGCEILGYNREDILGKNWFDNFLPKTLIENVKTIFEELLAGTIESEEYYENPILTKNGDKRLIAWHNTLLVDDKGNITGTLSSGKDITERKQSENKIRAEKEFTETALNAQLDTFFLFDPVLGKALRWNKTFRDVSGYTDDEIASLPALASYYSTNDLERAVSFVEKVMKEGSGTIELDFICKDGRKVPTEYRISAIYGEEGKPIQLISIGRDITERKLATDALRKSEERFRVAGTVAYDLIYEWNVETDSLEWFGDIDEILGFGKGEISQDINAWLSHIHPDDVSQLENAIEHHRKSTEPIEYEYRIRGKDGINRTWEDRAQPLINSEGRPYKWIGVCTDITDRKRAEVLLQESERKYREVIENASDVIMTTDINGNFKYINKAGILITGYSSNELVNFNYLDLVESDYKRRVRVHYQKQYIKKEPTSFIEYPYKTKSGEIRWFAQSASLMIESDQVVGFQLIARDVTERKQMEEERDVQMAYLGELFEGAPEAIAILDNEDRVRKINREFTNIFEYKVEEAIGCKINDLIVSADLKKEGLKATNDVSVGKSISLETVRCNKSGQLINVSILGNPIILRGDQLAVYGIYRDITKRKQVEEALLESEEKFRVISASALDAVILMDDEGNAAYWNPSAERIFGYTQDEIKGRNIHDILMPERYKAQAEKAFRTFKQKGEGDAVDNVVELTAIRKNGKEFPIEIAVSPILIKEKYWASAIIRDITKRKQAEEALLESEERFNQITESALEWIWEIDKNGLYTYSSPVIEQILGWKPSE